MRVCNDVRWHPILQGAEYPTERVVNGAAMGASTGAVREHQQRRLSINSPTLAKAPAATVLGSGMARLATRKAPSDVIAEDRIVAVDRGTSSQTYFQTSHLPSRTAFHRFDHWFRRMQTHAIPLHCRLVPSFRRDSVHLQK